METEKQLFNFAKKLCAKNKVGIYKMHCESKNGFPDLMLIYEGEIMFIELKSPNGKGRLSEIQKVRINELHNFGAEVYVIDCPKVLEDVITEFTN